MLPVQLRCVMCYALPFDANAVSFLIVYCRHLYEIRVQHAVLNFRLDVQACPSVAMVMATATAHSHSHSHSLPVLRSYLSSIIEL